MSFWRNKNRNEDGEYVSLVVNPHLDDDHFNDDGQMKDLVRSLLYGHTNEEKEDGILGWTANDVRAWLLTCHDGEFGDIVDGFHGIDGKALVKMTDTQMQKLVPGPRGFILNQSIQEKFKANHEDLAEEEEILKPVESSNIKYDSSFPSLIEKPSLKQIIIAIILIIIIVLAFTILQPQLSPVGLKTEILLKYGSIPFISVVFTYFHIWLALWMTFYPVEFFGCLQIPTTNIGIPGWQGIVPFKARTMAQKAVQLMTERLLDIKAEFGKLEPKKAFETIRPMLYRDLTTVIYYVGEKYRPSSWSFLPQPIKNSLINKAMEIGEETVNVILKDIRENLDRVLDLEEFVVERMVTQKALLNRMFISCGRSELCFIRNSGAVIGGIFGLIQMGIWILWHPAVEKPMTFSIQGMVVFPVIGLVVGLLTNWLALLIIFRPINPISLFGGKIILQGLFLQRQEQVSEVYGYIASRDIVHARDVLMEMLEGKNSAVLYSLIRKDLIAANERFIEEYGRIAKWVFDKKELETMREGIVDMMLSKVSETIKATIDFTQTSLDLETTLRVKLGALSSKDFEGLLHPVFEEDEWKLIVMGGALGVAVGFLQAYFIN